MTTDTNDGEDGTESNNGGVEDFRYDPQAIGRWVTGVTEDQRRAVIAAIRNPNGGLGHVSEIAGLTESEPETVLSGLANLVDSRTGYLPATVEDVIDGRTERQKAFIQWVAEHNCAVGTDGKQDYNQEEAVALIEDEYGVEQTTGNTHYIRTNYADMLAEARLAAAFCDPSDKYDEPREHRLWATALAIYDGGIDGVLRAIDVPVSERDLDQVGSPDAVDVAVYRPSEGDEAGEKAEIEPDDERVSDSDDAADHNMSTESDTADGADEDEFEFEHEYIRLPAGSGRNDVEFGVRYEAIVDATKPYGCFVHLTNEGYDAPSALVHRSKLPPIHRPQEFEQGDRVGVMLSERKDDGDISMEMVAILDADVDSYEGENHHAPLAAPDGSGTSGETETEAETENGQDDESGTERPMFKFEPPERITSEDFRGLEDRIETLAEQVEQNARVATTLAHRDTAREQRAGLPDQFAHVAELLRRDAPRAADTSIALEQDADGARITIEYSYDDSEGDSEGEE